MNRRIIIIGGGISGLTILHYLKRKFPAPEISVLLLEKNSYPGGTIQTIRRNNCLFETGPNGFLDNKQRTFQLVKELGLENDLVKSNPEAKLRFVSLKNKLYPIPANPSNFLFTAFLNPLDKIRILAEFFIPKKNIPEESIYAFGKRRLGRKFTEILLDAMVSGIYGGDINQMNLKAAFPRVYALEQEFGSLFKAMFALKKRKSVKGNGTMGMPTGTLTSFKNGIGQCVEALAVKYRNDILVNQEVKTVAFKEGQFKMETSHETFVADELFLCSPAYNASQMLRDLDSPISQLLQKIHYAPIAVAGLVFSLKNFAQNPKGFGFLIPTSQKKEVLGILFDSNIFPGRCPEGKILFRVMIGGSRFPEVLERSQEELIQIAVREIKTHFPLSGEPSEIFFTFWPRAIPQYDLPYTSIKDEIIKELNHWPHLHLVANYWNGISFNDCIENAFQTVEQLSLDPQPILKNKLK